MKKILLLERLKKYCSHPVRPSGSVPFGFWLRFRSVTGRCGHAPSLKPGQKPKILAPSGYSIFLTALAGVITVLATAGCIVPEGERHERGGYERHEEVVAPEVVVRPPEVIVR